MSKKKKIIYIFVFIVLAILSINSEFALITLIIFLVGIYFEICISDIKSFLKSNMESLVDQITSVNKQNRNDDYVYKEAHPTIYIFKMYPLTRDWTVQYSYRKGNQIIGFAYGSVEELAKTLKLYALNVMYENRGGEFKFIFSPPYDYIHSYPSNIEFATVDSPSEEEKKQFIDIYFNYTIEEYEKEKIERKV